MRTSNLDVQKKKNSDKSLVRLKEFWYQDQLYATILSNYAHTAYNWLSRVQAKVSFRLCILSQKAQSQILNKNQQWQIVRFTIVSVRVPSPAAPLLSVRTPFIRALRHVGWATLLVVGDQSGPFSNAGKMLRKIFT